MALYFTTYCSLSPLPSPCHSVALQSIVGLGIQYSLPPFPMVSDHCLPAFVPIMFKSSFPSSFLLLQGLLFTLPSIVAYAICFGVCWFCILSAWLYYLSRRDYGNFAISFSCKMSCYLLGCSYFPAFCSICRFLYFSYNLSFKYSEHVCYFSLYNLVLYLIRLCISACSYHYWTWISSSLVACSCVLREMHWF